MLNRVIDRDCCLAEDTNCVRVNCCWFTGRWSVQYM